MPRIVDARGMGFETGVIRNRLVSLVPSETASLVEWVGVERLVGRTLYCEEPRGLVEHVPTVGGTKDVDVDAVVALRPDLVFANREENTRAVVEALDARGVPVFVSFPTTLQASDAWGRAVTALLGVPPPRPTATQPRAEARRLRVFAPIWRDPWMTFDARTFAHDLLAHAGFDNVFYDRARRYPLAADLGSAVASSSVLDEARDTRYPRVALSEVRERDPDWILLPDEPYAFSGDDVRPLIEAGVRAAVEGRVRIVSGKDLFWYGVRAHRALASLEALRSALTVC